MGSRLLAGGGAVVVGAAVAFALISGASGEPAGDGTTGAKIESGGVAKPVVAPPSPREPEPVEALAAEPDDVADEGLVLSVPDDVSGWDEVTFTAAWTNAEGAGVQGPVDLQRVEGATWKTVADVEIGADGGSTDLKVGTSGIYRVAYGGSDEVGAVASNDVAVIVDGLLPSRVTATAAPAGDGTAEVTATWTTEGGVAIEGDLDLQVRRDGEWETVETVTTGADSKAETEIEADTGTKLRFVYDGGSRFDPVQSDTTTVVDEDVRTIEVRTCNNNGDLDALPYATACHWAPVTVDTFVTAHDYLGNAWWNSVPVGTLIELEGKQAGLYEVVDRVMAEGRGAALGAASNWTCGDACDVILQTCQGANTGFTWLRQVDEA